MVMAVSVLDRPSIRFVSLIGVAGGLLAEASEVDFAASLPLSRLARSGFAGGSALTLRLFSGRTSSSSVVGSLVGLRFSAVDELARRQ